MIPQLSFKTRTNCNTGVSLSALNLNMGEKWLSVTDAYLLHCHIINVVYSGITMWSNQHWSVLATWQWGPDQCWECSQVIALYTLHGMAKCLLSAQNEYRMAALSSIENDVHRVPQEVKQQHICITDMRKKWTIFLM
jgi:hypothetical protein